MNPLLDAHEHDHEPPADREISLGAATILGIFFALALICAAFFGFGYTVGRRAAQSTASAVPASTAPILTAAAPKPAAGSLAPQPKSAPPPPPGQVSDGPVLAAPAPAAHSLNPADSRIVGDPIPARITATPAPAIASAGTFMVQIAAVSSQEIADLELAALRKYGYDVVVRHEPQDALLHVQIGPYATRKDAEAMRQNVLAHGFNAIVK